jgi:hypothetical protein
MTRAALDPRANGPFRRGSEGFEFGDVLWSVLHRGSDARYGGKTSMKCDRGGSGPDDPPGRRDQCPSARRAGWSRRRNPPSRRFITADHDPPYGRRRRAQPVSHPRREAVGAACTRSRGVSRAPHRPQPVAGRRAIRRPGPQRIRKDREEEVSR